MNSFTAPLIGVPRILLMLLLCHVIYWHIRSDYEVVQILKIILFCYFIGALTLWYQVYYGNISWFAGMAGRGGVLRYSSILGSLTIFGSINGYAIILLFSSFISKNIIIKLIMFVILVSSTFISMQKSALAMLFISFLTLFIFNRVYIKNKFGVKKIILALLFILFLVALIKTTPTLERYYNANMTVTFGEFGEKNIFVDSSEVLKDNALSYEAILARVYGFTLGSINHYGYSSIILGVGLLGGAGTMGMQGGPMSGGIAHSTFGDLLLMGGVLYVLLFLMLYCKVQLCLYRDKMNPVCSTLFMCNILFLVNMLATSGVTIQPSISIIFWLSVAYVARKSTFTKKLRIV